MPNFENLSTWWCKFVKGGDRDLFMQSRPLQRDMRRRGCLRLGRIALIQDLAMYIECYGFKWLCTVILFECKYLKLPKNGV